MSIANRVQRETRLTAHRKTSEAPAVDTPLHSDEGVQQFLGTWRLVGFFKNGQPHPAYGAAPRGTIRYESNGQMAVQIMPDTACAPNSAGDYIAYFGSYRVDTRARTVAHERVGNVVADEPRTVVRHYEFLPDGRLALTLDEDATAQVLWRRVH